MISKKDSNDAIRRSIEKWRFNSQVSNVADARLGRDQCPLCVLFRDGRCIGCPVMRHTGQVGCEGTNFEHVLFAKMGIEMGVENFDLANFHKEARTYRQMLEGVLHEETKAKF